MSRITPGTMIVAIFAVLFGLVGAYAARRYFEQPAAAPKKAAVPVDTFVNVPLASMHLDKGRELKMGDVSIVRVKQSEAKKVTFGREYMPDPRQIIGRILREDLPKGKTFQADLFYPEGMGPTLAEQLEEGYQAKSIPVRGTGILGGLATPGAIVDVIFRTNESPTKEIPKATITVLQGVQVLAVQENTVPGARNPRSATDVTLAVKPRQARALTILEGEGEFSLTLRKAKDKNNSDDMDPQTLEGLLGIVRRPPPLPPAPPQYVEKYTGTSMSVLVFKDGRPAPALPPANNNPHPLRLSPAVSLPPGVEAAIPNDANLQN